ncbi:adenylate/guanylate cyclase domain-containing protein [Enterovirga rhinocerotis]|uniref:Adenylate cyclase n=1 Tax=Enterovirga rhinocerotis TaxID=1339210 RepID=A0A4R7BJQ4_9HYPH|nr:adenylate/guanylate cyclase domain-containing protein [Enterovirga rhinocerotis]TDR85233.1 adenylate cyclase [Enterovirga rhinocerotis]
MTIDEAALATARAWIVRVGLTSDDPASLLTGASERLLEAGIPLVRTHISFATLDPCKRAENIVWSRGHATRREFHDHEQFEQFFPQSPFPEMLKTGQLQRRWQLETPDDGQGFPVIQAIRDEGATDLVVQIVPFRGTSEIFEGFAFSAATDRPGGFADPEVALLNELAPTMALSSYRIATSDALGSVLRAYLGAGPGDQILRGRIRPGEGHRIMAAILLADLRGFTSATEREGPGVIGRLGQHLGAIAEPVEAAGGEVFKFIGDGLLAAFPVSGETAAAACDAAIAAAREAMARNDAVNTAHPGTPRLDLDIALHLGEVFYGNIGAASRLEFTAIGPAVNEAARLEGLCGQLDRAILMSESFARACSAPATSVGRFELRGVSGIREVFAPEASEPA